MQEKIQIVSDGSLDLPNELVEEKRIKVVPFYVSFDGETYVKENPLKTQCFQGIPIRAREDSNPRHLGP